MTKQGMIEQDGVVTEAMPNATFRVKLENGHEILAICKSIHDMSAHYCAGAPERCPRDRAPQRASSYHHAMH